ncbi:MAG: thioredoxin domain-containing protein [SAR324 cluster bacterium]|nr:thioredoxin domain-containing protein [SAR324 cluster bacterium]
MSAATKPAHTNRLAQEKSPYLLQHAHNPVDWYPWGKEAFAKAAGEDKMVLVSIGYATCHWCHVMERESFENEETARFLNENFVTIKVDREERPDVDKIYMDSLHALGQQGGWPLNMFTTPDGRPVTGGTYFPPDAAHGRKSFREILELLLDAWRNNRAAILENAELLTRHLQEQARPGGSQHRQWNYEAVEAALEAYAQAFDSKDGGFTLQPQNKFPPSMGLMLLLRHHARTGDSAVLEMVELTLKKMIAGGIYDQLGGGLSRYSTDYRWLVPHFEKMLYDNALFVQALTEAHLATGKAIYRAYAEDVLAYVRRDMTSPEGAFYSAEDADSEGVEGKFYVWSPGEVEALLEAEDARCAMAYWDISPQGNFEGDSIPNTPRGLAEVAAQLDLGDEELAERLQRAREIMLEARAKRVRPLRDDKVLTSWNALMISAFARAGRAFEEAAYVETARKAGRFIIDNLRDGSGRLLRRYREGEARYKGYLVDHAQLAGACLDLYEATHDSAWFGEALGLMREVNRLFRNEDGPYFDTGSDSEQLLARNMDGYDGVEPSGNSAAAEAFLRLHAYGVREGFDEDALRIFAGFHDHLHKAGSSFSAMLNALAFHLSPPREVAVVGDAEAADTRAMLEALATGYHPALVTAFASPRQAAQAAGLIPLLEGRATVDKPTAWVCRDMVCQLPVHNAADLRAQLAEG